MVCDKCGKDKPDTLARLFDGKVLIARGFFRKVPDPHKPGQTVDQTYDPKLCALCCYTDARTRVDEANRRSGGVTDAHSQLVAVYASDWRRTNSIGQVNATRNLLYAQQVTGSLVLEGGPTSQPDAR